MEEDDLPVVRRPNLEKPAPKASARTSKYVFSSSPAVQQEMDEDEEPETEETRKRKEALHKRFIAKLGRPDVMAEIKRRNHFITEETEVVEGEEGEEEEEDPAPKKGKGKKGGGARANGKLTPMETQYLQIKREHLDTVIVYQVGYKYRFFGEDARTASKALGLVCIPGKMRFDERKLISSSRFSGYLVC